MPGAAVKPSLGVEYAIPPDDPVVPSLLADDLRAAESNSRLDAMSASRLLASLYPSVVLSEAALPDKSHRAKASVMLLMTASTGLNGTA